MRLRRTAHTQLNRGKRLKDAVKLRRPVGGNGASILPKSFQESPERSPQCLPESPTALDAATGRILEHLTGTEGLTFPAQDERRLLRALALLGTERTGEYSAALQKAITTLESLTQEIIDVTLAMAKGLKTQIDDDAPAWTESGPKSRSEAVKNLATSLQLLQGYGRGLMGAPDKVEEHRHIVETDESQDPRAALQEIEQILTGRTIHFLPSANGDQDEGRGDGQ